MIDDTIWFQSIERKTHTILILEDDPDFRKKIENRLSSHFLKLIVTDSAENAIKELDMDKINSITGIVTDWRLYKDQVNKDWQLQGYEVLDYAAKTHFISLFSLTSLADRNVNKIRNALGLDVHLFKKQHFEEMGEVQWDMMADTVVQKCDAIVEIISSQPTGTNWDRLKPEYILKRGVGWSVFENEIAHDATKIFKYYFDAINSNEQRNVVSLSELGLTLKGDLRNILVARRVFFGIYICLVRDNNYLQNISPNLLGDGNNFNTELKHHAIDAYSLLRKDWWDEIINSLDSTEVRAEWLKFEQRMKNLRGTLCIELMELPNKGILVEEKNWLIQNNVDYSFLFNYWKED